jgi:hypothetical protein
MLQGRSSADDVRKTFLPIPKTLANSYLCNLLQQSLCQQTSTSLVTSSRLACAPKWQDFTPWFIQCHNRNATALSTRVEAQSGGDQHLNVFHINVMAISQS